MATLVKSDLFTTNGSSPATASLTNINGTLYFIANNGVNGYELWKSDCTAAGTSLFKDINSGGSGSSLSNLTNVNGTLYFRARDVVNGYELWKSDGTAAGTSLVKDIFTGGSNSNPSNLTNVNGTLYFTADDGINGTKIWTTDGTSANTQIADMAVFPTGLVSFLDKLFFQAVSPDGLRPGLQFLNTAPTNTAPTITSAASTNFAENGTRTVYIVTATDPDAATTLTYSIGGTDASRFDINSSTGGVTFKASPNFEVPTDNDANNIYDINVIASDGLLFDTKAVAITVTDVNEAPIATSAIASQAINNGSAFNYSFANNVFADPEAAALTYSISGNPAWLNFDPTSRTFSGTANSAGTSTITVSASDGTNVTSTNFALIVNTPVVATSVFDQSGATSGQTIIGTAIADNIFGSAFNDLIRAGDGDDDINGNGGNDRLYGDGGNDIIVGGFGTDNLYGGLGSDTFVIQAAGNGLDIVNDFQNGVDFIGLSGLNSGGLSFDSLTFTSFGTSGASTSIRSGGVEIMRLINVAPTLITNADFKVMDTPLPN